MIGTNTLNTANLISYLYWKYVHLVHSSYGDKRNLLGLNSFKSKFKFIRSFLNSEGKTMI